MYTLQYYCRIETKWLKGRIRNLTYREAVNYSHIITDLFGDKTMFRFLKVKDEPEMTKNELRCGHGKRIWRNYGDGKTRHLTEDGQPGNDICNKDN